MDNHPSFPLRVLLLEDSTTDAELICLQMKKDGLVTECKRVDNEQDFVAALDWNPDLILSDYSLPHYSGPAALELVRQQGMDTPFIVISGAIGEDVIVDVIKQGADDYIMKDRLTRLGYAIRNAMEQKRLRDARQSTEEALHATEERLNLFFTQSLDGLFFMMLDEPVRWDDTVDKEKVLDYVFEHQRITRINNAMLAQYRAKREEFVGLTPKDLLSHNIEEGRSIWKNFFDAGHLGFVTDERRFDGTQMWVEGDYVCMYDSQGRITGHFGIQRDITERKLAEEKLRQLSRAVEQSPETIVITDTQGNIQYANPKFAQTTGYSVEEVIGKNPRILKSGHTSQEEYQKMWDMILAGDEWRGEFLNKKKNGELYWESVSLSPIFDEQDKITHFVGIKEEITARKQVEENLRKAEAKFRTMAEKIPPMIYITELDQHIGVTYISPRIETLGFTQEEWIADPELWFRQIHQEDQEKVKADIEQSVLSGKPFKSEYRIVARDGSIRWLLDEAVDILDNAGTPLFRQGFMLDITERKIAEEALASRERFMAVLNDMTRAILLSSDFDATLQAIANDMRKIVHADDCYIMGWDEELKHPVALATTAELEIPFSEYPSYPEEIGIVASILRTGHILAIDDVYDSPTINVDIIKRFPIRSGIGIPLIAGGHKLGVVFIAFKSPHTITQEEMERAEQAGNQIALALLEFQQNDEIQRRLRESNALNEISRALGEMEHVGLDKVLQLIVDSALSLIQRAEESVIHLLDAGKEVLLPRAFAGFEAGEKTSERPSIGLKEGVAGRVLDTGETINIGDIYTSDLYVHKENMPTYHSLLVAPVHSGDLHIGTISVQSTKIHAFSNSDAELLNALSNQAAIAIENTRLFEATQQSLKEMNSLYRTGQGLASSLNADELIEEVVNLLEENFGYYHVQIYLLDLLNGDPVLKCGSGEAGDRMVAEDFRVPRGTGIISHVIETGMPFFTNDVNAIVFFFRNPYLPDTQSEMAVPIKVEGKVVGVIDVHEKPPARLTANDLRLTIAVADQLAVALQRAELYTSLQSALQQEQTIRSQLVQSERLALVGRLLASVSHELNNPLQAIQNALFLLKEEEHLSTQGKQDLEVVLSEAERMAALIERLRSAYRPGRVKDFRPVDINSLIEDVHMLIATHMRHKQIAFEFYPDPDLPPVSGMSDQMRQVILNLFINAIEAMEPGGRLFIWTQNLPEQNEILLTVKDTGPGISDEILPHIFDAFITDKQTGTGLGLTISRDIIEQHFGRITAQNDPQGGAVFHIWLPMAKQGEA